MIHVKDNKTIAEIGNNDVCIFSLCGNGRGVLSLANDDPELTEIICNMDQQCPQSDEIIFDIWKDKSIITIIFDNIEGIDSFILSLQEVKERMLEYELSIQGGLNATESTHLNIE